MRPELILAYAFIVTDRVTFRLNQSFEPNDGMLASQSDPGKRLIQVSIRS